MTYAESDKNACITSQIFRISSKLSGVLRQIIVRFPLGFSVILLCLGAYVSVFGWKNLYYDRLIYGYGLMGVGGLFMSCAYLLWLSV